MHYYYRHRLILLEVLRVVEVRLILQAGPAMLHLLVMMMMISLRDPQVRIMQVLVLLLILARWGERNRVTFRMVHIITATVTATATATAIATITATLQPHQQQYQQQQYQLKRRHHRLLRSHQQKQHLQHQQQHQHQHQHHQHQQPISSRIIIGTILSWIQKTN